MFVFGQISLVSMLLWVLHTHPRDLQAGCGHITCDTLQSRFHHKGLNGPFIMAERSY